MDTIDKLFWYIQVLYIVIYIIVTKRVKKYILLKKNNMQLEINNYQYLTEEDKENLASLYKVGHIDDNSIKFEITVEKLTTSSIGYKLYEIDNLAISINSKLRAKIKHLSNYKFSLIRIREKIYLLDFIDITKDN